MALSKTVLRDLLNTKIASANANYAALSSGERAELLAVYEAIADAIITHLTTSGVVTVTSVSGVTTGSGVSGPGSGTIS